MKRMMMGPLGRLGQLGPLGRLGQLGLLGPLGGAPDGATGDAHARGLAGRPVWGAPSGPSRPSGHRRPILLAGLVGLCLLCGCSAYTVVPADREMVPVRRAPEVSPDVYLRTREGATGWYVPDAVMLELLEAE